VQVDIVQPTSPLDGYGVVIAPQLYLLTSDAAANLIAYAESGGHLLVTAFSDIVDENDAFRDGGYLTQLGRTLGIWLEDFGALVAPGSDGPGQRSAPFDLVGSTVTGTLLAEEIHVETAATLGSFVGGRLDGRPAFTVNPVGAGRAYYLATIPDEAGCAAVAAAIFAAADIHPVALGLPDTVEAIRRGDVVTLINHGTETVTLPDGATLEPFGYVMLQDQV